MKPQLLCAESEIAEGQGRGFVFGASTRRLSIFVVRWQGALRAYYNDCPHRHTPLDWPENAFFDQGGELLKCRTHGALFHPGDGTCAGGPCAGYALDPCEIMIENGLIYSLEV